MFATQAMLNEMVGMVSPADAIAKYCTPQTPYTPCTTGTTRTTRITRTTRTTRTEPHAPRARRKSRPPPAPHERRTRHTPPAVAPSALADRATERVAFQAAAFTHGSSLVVFRFFALTRALLAREPTRLYPLPGF
eukprot:2284008-Pleurochrysis_carterae.AAC.1